MTSFKYPTICRQILIDCWEVRKRGELDEIVFGIIETLKQALILLIHDNMKKKESIGGEKSNRFWLYNFVNVFLILELFATIQTKVVHPVYDLFWYMPYTCYARCQQFRYVSSTQKNEYIQGCSVEERWIFTIGQFDRDFEAFFYSNLVGEKFYLS